MPTIAEPIMPRLKSATADRHRTAESRPLQRSMARGEVDPPTFARYLGQLLLIHTALERALDECVPECRAVGSVFRDHHRRSEALRADLAHHGGSPDVTPLPVTVPFIRTIERLSVDRPVALLGALYVLEGSTNGNRFIARALGGAWGIDDGRGLRSLDPHGEEQGARWAAFRSDMDALELDPEDAAAVVGAACDTFDAIAAISDAV